MLKGVADTDLPVPADRVYAVVADVEGYPTWQSMVDHVDVRERDDAGRPRVVVTSLTTKIKVLRLVLRYAYESESRVSWSLEDGDVKQLHGSWEISPRGPEACHVTYRLAVDPGRGLGLLLRGGAADRVRARVVDGTVADLARVLGVAAA